MIHTNVHSKTGVYKSFKHEKMSDKVDFIAANPCEHSEEFLDIFYKNNCVNIS